LDTLFGIMYLVWAGGGLRAVARVVLAEVRLLAIKIGIVSRSAHGTPVK
jgi:hypothetical protein